MITAKGRSRQIKSQRNFKFARGIIDRAKKMPASWATVRIRHPLPSFCAFAFQSIFVQERLQTEVRFALFVTFQKGNQYFEPTHLPINTMSWAISRKIYGSKKDKRQRYAASGLNPSMRTWMWWLFLIFPCQHVFPAAWPTITWTIDR